MLNRLLFSLFLLCISALSFESRAAETQTSRIPASRLIIYSVNISDFTGTSGKALGDGTAVGMTQSVAALKSHGGTPLDYLAQLGVDAIQFAPDKACGTADDYKALIEASHLRGLAVILDFTPTASVDFTTLDSWITDCGADGFSMDVDPTEAVNLYSRLSENHPDIYFINKTVNTQVSDGVIGTTNLNAPSCRYVGGQLDDASLSGFCPTYPFISISYAENFDTDRVAYQARLNGVSAVKGTSTSSATNRLRRLGSLAAQMLMCPGPHMLRQFQELGADHVSLNADGTPNLAPKTVLWNNINNQLYRSLHDTYAALCDIRHRYPRMFDGSAISRISLSSATERFISLTDGETDLFLLVNPAVSGNAVVAAEDAMTGRHVDLTISGTSLLLSSPDVTPSATPAGVSLPGGAFAIYTRQHESPIYCIPADTHSVPQIDIVDGVITPRENYNTLIIRTPAGLTLRPDTRLQPGLYLVTIDSHTLKVIVH